MLRIAMVFCVVLAGCASPEQVAREQEEYRQALLSQCDRMGFRRGTDAHANCVLQSHTSIQANQSARDIARRQNAAAQAQQNQINVPTYRPVQPMPTTQCVRDFGGNSMTCAPQRTGPIDYMTR